MRISRFLFVLAAAGVLAACTKPADDTSKVAEGAAPAEKNQRLPVLFVCHTAHGNPLRALHI